ncbi:MULTISPECIES: SAM-dependent methyltransferase [unclassified Ensifer]|uniref:SAM-dependent methyltransferase n=1 Tax=unclassified Ensifer TaxID=2633371 RepID=UPI0012E3673F|nr:MULTISPECIES: class I SAM-dependent methyltransferase [unclassified Ensifer]
MALRLFRVLVSALARGGIHMGLNRIDWAVGVIAPQPSDHLLEVGCGHGIAVTKVCDRLDEGEIVAIDRSAVMIAAAARRNAEHVAAGRATLRVAELSSFDLGGRRFDKAFAMRVGVFTRGDPAREFAALAQLLKPEGRLFLFHDEPSTGADDVGARLAAAALRHRWLVEALSAQIFDSGEVACLIARPPA